MKSTEQTAKDRSQTQEIEALKGELELARRQLREFKLWHPLREIALKCGLDKSLWDLARLELTSQKRFDLDQDGEITVTPF